MRAFLENLKLPESSTKALNTNIGGKETIRSILIAGGVEATLSEMPKHVDEQQKLQSSCVGFFINLSREGECCIRFVVCGGFTALARALQTFVHASMEFGRYSCALLRASPLESRAHQHSQARSCS